MTLDEAITHAREVAQRGGECAKDHEQLTEWLEELRKLKTIADTSGSGKLTAKQVKRIHAVIEKHWHDLPADYDMPEATALPKYSYDWQVIADELNATLGGSECERVKRGTKPDGTPRYRCSVCGYGLGDYRWAYCPKCGRKIRKAVKR